jgi:guanylate kinase
MNLRAAISVSYTTRSPRPGERDGEHYHFVAEDDFLRRIGEGDFFEHAEVFDRRYGTGRKTTESLMSTGCHVLLDIDWQGARQVRARAPDAVSIFILPPSIETLESRLRGRGQDSDATIERRMIAARNEIAHYDEYDFIIVNADFQRATEELVALVIAQTLKRDAQSRRHCDLLETLLGR